MAGSWRIYNAAARGDESKLADLLDSNIDPNWCHENGSTPLRVACLNNRVGCVGLLLRRGASCEAIERARGGALVPSEPPLITAVSHGRAECAALLIGAGACIYAVDRNGRNALELCIQRNCRGRRTTAGDKSCLDLLVKKHQHNMARVSTDPKDVVLQTGFVVVHPGEELSLASVPSDDVDESFSFSLLSRHGTLPEA